MPFVDRRVVAHSLGAADALKCDRREGKKILKDWAEGFMPAEHFAAKKRGTTYRLTIGIRETDSGRWDAC